MRLLFVVACYVMSLAAGVLPVFGPGASSPYFEVWASDAEATASNTNTSRMLNFPLQLTKVEATVSNGIVQAKVTQVYKNDGLDCLNSRYIFPLPTGAAISALVMRIGDRTVEGQIRTRAQARDEFETARDKGQSASLLDQERPNVFAMELANILPAETTEVTVEYTETLNPVDGIFAFTFPTVVGPRYGQGWAPGSDTSNLLTQVNVTMLPACLGLDSNLSLAVSNGQESTQVGASNMNGDIVIKFWFTKGDVGAQFLLSQREQERYFSLAIQPPQRRLLQDSQIARREYLFILDVSGSMTGYPIDLSKKLMVKLLKENLREGDSLNILLFAGGQAVLNSEGNVPATKESVDDAISWLDENMRAGGGTQLLPALEKAFRLPRSAKSDSRTIVVMTDGYVTVEKEAFDIVRNNLGEGNVFVFGVGSSVNHYLVEGLARVGYGAPFIVTDETKGDEVVKKLQRYIDTPVLTRLRLTFDGEFKAEELEPPYLPDVFASRPIQVVGKWTGQLSGQVRLTGYLPGGEAWEYSADVAHMNAREVPVVPLLWARSRIATLADYASLGINNTEKITALGLKYSLMTKYTSFVAVDSNPSAPNTCAAAADASKKAPTSPNSDYYGNDAEDMMLYASHMSAHMVSSSPCVWRLGATVAASLCWAMFQNM